MSFFKNLSWAVLMLPLWGCNQKPDLQSTVRCSAFPDQVVSVTVDQIKSAWPCMLGRTIVVQGYLAEPAFEDGPYLLYDNVDALKYNDFGRKIGVKLTEEDLSKLGVDLSNGAIVRVKVTSSASMPEVLDSVSRIVLLE